MFITTAATSGKSSVDDIMNRERPKYTWFIKEKR